ncbi:glycosyltransferase [Halocatena pleomorpha]|uniref:Glycosyl transferase family 28 C-terminal domain-containing protein n=1 Tax=Halocatena pleomorpha TaxID=1785090 RepID=A0A3P3R8R3_9EURY|nr:hypothetical protein [Halocatena pleomorpha]RRJ29764.1 hypothetical protein EIK79_11770 [Halocatena pleomorpha]
MTPRIAVAHYPEGAGHATRMLAVAWAVEERGATVTVAGGGPGTRFIRMNGYEPYVPTPVDFINTRQFDTGGVITDSVPSAVRRVYDLVRWLRRESPVALVTDDMFATMAATLTRTPVYNLTHNTPGLYTRLLERTATTVLTRYHRLISRSFFYPAVWESCSADPSGVVRVPPIALEGDDDTPEIDVLLVPSVYSSGVSALASRLRAAGRDVTRVGGPTWEPVASLFPYIASATIVVCSGYSTVMEAAVAGTPCVVRPFTDEQRGVTRLLSGTDGFTVVETSREVTESVADPPTCPDFENGTDIIADRVMADIEAEQSSPRSTARDR